MRDVLLDIVKHTHSLGFIQAVKVNGGDGTATEIEAMDDDRTVVLKGKLHNPVSEFKGTMGLGKLPVLAGYLNFEGYADKTATIEVVTSERNGEQVPEELKFTSGNGYTANYRFMVSQLIEEKLKTVKFKGASWNVTLQPSVAAIARMKLMSAAHSEEPTFNVKTVDGNLVFSFGDASTHAGEFVFQHDVEGSLQHTWSWPVAQVQSILNLDGDLTMSISDQGAMMITVDSGMAKYDYILPAQSK